MLDCFAPGQLWLDTNGTPIQAHGFSVFYENGIYYWYGENKEYTKGGLFNRIWHWGVRCYSSIDLYNWKDCGLIIPPQPNDLSSPLHPTYCMDRPHIIFCKKTKKYVAWLKIMCGTTDQFISVMQADDFLGPYEFVKKIYKPLNMDTGDFTLVKDPQSDKAYFIFDRPHFEVVTATLTDDYTAVTGEYSEHYCGLQPPYAREAPTYFYREGRHYLITSGTTGYYPNQSLICVFDDFHGDYKDLGDFCMGDDDLTSFYSQFTCVLQVPNTEVYIAMADRWMPKAKDMRHAKKNALKANEHFEIKEKSGSVETECLSKAESHLPEKWLFHGENTSISRYVWLPIQFDRDKPTVRWQDRWNLSERTAGRNIND